MKTHAKNFFLALVTCLAVSCAQAGVVFTNLVFFTYTNAPNYGWNANTPSGRTSALVQGNDGNFYGTTYGGGDTTGYDGGGDGTVFRMTPGGAFTSIYSFDTIVFEQDGRGPVGNLIKGADGSLYGATEYGGNSTVADNGSLFQITTNNTLSTLYTFGSAGYYLDGGNFVWPDGRFPFAGVVQGSDGNFYGTTATGGDFGEGTVFQLIPGGTLNIMHSFTALDTNTAANTDGGMPVTELTEGPDGSFYGTTYWGGTNAKGEAFRITSGGTLTPLHSFDGTDGGAPFSPLVLGKDGNFYGTSAQGGESGLGTVFQMTTNGTLTTLYSFSDYYDGGDPSGLIQGSDGNFYGTTKFGGAYFPFAFNSGGTVFRITTNGTLTTLYSFSGPDGQEPQGALVQSTDGSFYGTTSYGGPGYDPSNPVDSGYGAIFRITLAPGFQAITQSNGIATFTWSILPGQTYQVQANTDLNSTNWVDLGSAVTATNTTATAMDSMSHAQCFYRILLPQ